MNYKRALLVFSGRWSPASLTLYWLRWKLDDEAIIEPPDFYFVISAQRSMAMWRAFVLPASSRRSVCLSAISNNSAPRVENKTTKEDNNSRNYYKRGFLYTSSIKPRFDEKIQWALYLISWLALCEGGKKLEGEKRISIWHKTKFIYFFFFF
jgi:hypothetical protein